jgi:histidine triad (HIT) family protein
VSGGCVFCRIAAGQTPADIEYEDEAVLAFKDIYPKAPVHLLIIPKRHIESLARLEPGDAELVGRCVLVARELGQPYPELLHRIVQRSIDGHADPRRIEQ